MLEYIRADVIEVLGTALAVGASFAFRKTRGMWSSLFQYITGWRPPSGHGSSEGHAKEYSEIQRILVETMTKCNADRIYVVQYHNGNTFESNKPIWKLSCTNEVCKEGVSYEVSKLQGLPVTLLWECIAPLYGESVPGVNKVPPVRCQNGCSNRGVLWFDTLTMPESQLAAILKSRGSVGTATSPLISGKNIVGYIGLDYTKLPIPADLCNLCEAATKISLILSK